METYDIKVGNIKNVQDLKAFHKAVMDTVVDNNITVNGDDVNDVLKKTFADNATKAQEAYAGATVKKETLDDAIKTATATAADADGKLPADALKALITAIKTFTGEETKGGRSKKSSKRGGSKRRGKSKRGGSKSKGRKY